MEWLSLSPNTYRDGALTVMIVEDTVNFLCRESICGSLLVCEILSITQELRNYVHNLGW